MNDFDMIHTYKYVFKKGNAFTCSYITGNSAYLNSVESKMKSDNQYDSIVRCYVCSLDPRRRDVEVVYGVKDNLEDK